jgi:hypothetical protein
MNKRLSRSGSNYSIPIIQFVATEVEMFADVERAYTHTFIIAMGCYAASGGKKLPLLAA